MSFAYTVDHMQVDASGTVQRRHHGSAAFRLSERPTTTKVIIFGGCQTQPTSSIQHDDDLLPIADTTSFGECTLIGECSDPHTSYYVS